MGRNCPPPSLTETIRPTLLPKGAGVDFGAGARLLQRGARASSSAAFRLLDAQHRPVDLVRSPGDQRIEDLAGVGDVAEAHRHFVGWRDSRSEWAGAAIVVAVVGVEVERAV
jgi:hypothetical protein